MEMRNYLDTVIEQVRCKRARPMIEDELMNHIEEQTESYIMGGYNPAEAMDLAVTDMGDPIQTGVALNNIHRPKLEWHLILMVVLMSALGIFLQYKTTFIGMDIEPVRRQIFFTLIGLVVMIAIYFFNYTILARYSIQLWFCLCFLCLIINFKGRIINGVNTDMFYILLLFIPLYSGILYQFRNKGLKVILYSCFLLIGPLFFSATAPSFTGAAIVLSICFIMLMTAICKGWFIINKRKTILGISTIILLIPMAVLFINRLLNVFLFSDYSFNRLKIALGLMDNDSMNYHMNTVKEVLINAKLIGNSLNTITVPLISTDFIITFLIGYLGILACSVLVIFLAIFIFKIFKISRNQKNQLGSMLCFSCGLLLTFQIFIYMGANLGSTFFRLMFSQMTIPFLGYGAYSTIVSYIFIGLILSIYRNTELISEKSLRQKA